MTRIGGRKSDLRIFDTARTLSMDKESQQATTQDHDAVTLAADADVLLGLSGQELNFDSQAANLVLAGPASGGAVDPTFRALASDDVPTLDHGTKITGLGDDDHPQYFLLAGETTDAKLYSGADLILYSDAGATEVARWTGTGRIGINNNSPTYEIDIGGFTAGAKALRLAAASGADTSVRLMELNDNYGFSLAYDASGNIFNITRHNNDQPGTKAISIERATGDVGIGTTGPDARLDVLKTTTQLRLTHTDGSAFSDFAVSAGGDLTIDPTGGNLLLDADLDFQGTQSITTSSGNLTVKPTGDLLLDPTGQQVIFANWNSGDSFKSSDYASQTTGFGISHPGDGDFRYLFADEMHVKSFIADLEQALAGGQIICKSVAVVASDFTLPAAGNGGTLVVEDLPGAANMAVFQANDIVRLRQFSRPAGGSLTIADAWGVVTGYSDNAGGTQDWTFTRSAGALAGTASGTIEKGQLALDYGTSPGGYWEVNAIDGSWAQNSPYAQTVSWVTHPQASANRTVRMRLGNLRGITSAAGEYGLFAGTGFTDSDQYVRISAVQGGTGYLDLHNIDLTLHDGTAARIQLVYDKGILINDTSGVWGNNTTTFAAVFANDGTVTSLDAGDVIIGKPFHGTAASQKGIHWDNSASELFIKADSTNYLKLTGNDLLFYSNNINTILLDGATGDFIFGEVDDNKSNLFWDRSAGQLNFRGGTGGTETEAYINSAGAMVAGGGNVVLNSDGATLTGADFANSVLRFVQGANAARVFFDATPTLTFSNEDAADTDGAPAFEFQYWDGLAWTVGLMINRKDDTFGGSPSTIVSALDANTVRAGNKIYIYETENDEMTQGLTINQGANDDEALALKSSDVAHAITDEAETDTYGVLEKSSAGAGGLAVRGYRDSAGAAGQALNLVGRLAENADTATTAAGIGIVTIIAQIKDGANGVTSVNAGGNLLAIRDHASTRAIFNQDGDLYLDTVVNENDWDEYDDVGLLHGFRASLAPDGGQLQREFGQWIDYARPILERTGVVHYDDDTGHHFVATKKLQMLTIDAVRQLYGRLERYERALVRLGADPALLQA